jgi:uncharacterized RDD family membrane protein YckC
MTLTSTSTVTFKNKSNLKKRIIATLIDYALFLIPMYMYIMYFGQFNNEGGKTVSGLMALPIPIVWVIYFVVIEAYYGSTLAHQSLYLKVLTVDRKQIQWTQALKRHLLDPIDILFYGIPAIIAIKNSEKHQRLGDMWAKTIVVDTKDTEQYFVNTTSKLL